MDHDVLVYIFDEVPGRITAALLYAEYCKSLTDPCQCCNEHAQGRPLSPREQAAYVSALEALRLYFSGEIDLGGPAMAQRLAPAAQALPAPEQPPAAPATLALASLPSVSISFAGPWSESAPPSTQSPASTPGPAPPAPPPPPAA